MVIYACQNNLPLKKGGWLFILLTFIVMVLFAGLRDEFVGTDTFNYVYKFRSLANEIATVEENNKGFLEEPGYELIQKIALFISTDYWSLLCVIASVFSAFVLIAINKYSNNRLLSLFLFITLGYYTYCFNGARQAIALSIYMMSFEYILNGKFLKYSIWILIAFLFHRSVIIALPLFFIFRMRFSTASIILISISGLLISQLLPLFLEAAIEIDEKYIVYAENDARGGYLLTAFYVLLSIFFIYLRRHIPKNGLKKYDTYLQMLICGSVIYLVVSLSDSYVELTRFAAYFQTASIFLFAETYNRNRHILKWPMLTCIIIGCLIFYYIFVSSMAALIPYNINPEIY